MDGWGGVERWERQRYCVVLVVVTSCLVGKTGRVVGGSDKWWGWTCMQVDPM